MDERVELTGAIEGLGRLISPTNSRLIAGLATHPLDGSLDDLLVQGPQAVNSYLRSGNDEEARNLLQNIESRIGGLTKVKNYGYGIEGHHSIALGSALLAAEGLSVPDAARFYQQSRVLGLPIGTAAENMLPVTRLAHDFSHLDPVTHKTNKRAFQDVALMFTNPDPIRRANEWAPSANLEASISNLGFMRPEEQELRRKAGQKIGISPEMLYSTETNPDYRTPTGRAGNQTYAQTAYKILDQPAMLELIKQAWGTQTMEGMIEPTQYKKIFANKNRAPEYRNRKSTNAKFDLSVLRPGQMELMRRFV